MRPRRTCRTLPLFWRDPATGQPSETCEHIDFNLETYSQDAELTPAAATTLNTTDYAGNAGSVQVPAGAVAQSTTLSYYPLVASTYAAPQGKTLVRPFRLTAALQGVPQAAFEFSTPVALAVRYDDARASAPCARRRSICIAGTRTLAGSRPTRAARRGNVTTTWIAPRTWWWSRSAT